MHELVVDEEVAISDGPRRRLDESTRPGDNGLEALLGEGRMGSTTDAQRRSVHSVLHTAFEDAPFEFWVRDSDDRCVVQNAAARKWGDQRGRCTDESSVPSEISAAWRENNRRAHAGELVQNEVECWRGGEKRHFQCVVVPMFADGDARGILGFNIDITERRRAEEALRESERRLREALRIGRMGYLDWDLTTNEIRWSPETYRLFGYEPGGAFVPTIDATVGMVPPEDRAFVEEHLNAVISGAAAYDIDHRMVRPDGEVIHVHAQGEVMRDETGRALRMLGTVVDVTERRRAEEALRISEERLKQSLKAASAGTWDWDIRTGEIIGSQENWELYGLEEGDRERSFADWYARLHPADLAAVESSISDALAGRTTECRAEFRVQAGGSERWVLAIGQVRRAPDGTPLRMSGISINITERKRVEEKLREEDRRRNEFLGVLSHELRNPLTPIRNNLYVLGCATPGGDQARRALAVVERQVNHLARLVDDLLDVTRISSGKIRLQRAPLDLVDLVRHTVDDHQTLFTQREVSVSLPDEAMWINGDAMRLAQVIGNLLTNAAKFTPERGRIQVSLAKAGERAVLEVADSGLGMDAETLGRLFVPFAQADRSLDRSRGGLGLGLALVKSLVEMHGGEVSARSDGPGRGAYFTVQLALEARRVETLPTPSPADPSAASGILKVLVIEDNEDAAQSLAETFALWGHEVAIALDGTSGLARARELAPDVILCDIGLPGELDGYAVARALQQDAALAAAHRVALTGYAQPMDHTKALEAGFEAHLAKPPDLDALRRLLAGAPRRGSRR